MKGNGTGGYHGIIPARFASSRFPGKPLADIGGKPMFWHVADRAMRSGLDSVTLATDDARIAEAARLHNVAVIMTRPDHQSGTDRVYEAACLLGLPDNAVVVNVQGDEPALDPGIIAELIAPFANPEVRVTTVAAHIPAERAGVPDQVKVVMNTQGDALYFSRAGIPFEREQSGHEAAFWGHIGLYAFRMEALRLFVSLPQSRLELTEKLEQLRLLENGIPIRVVRSTRHSPGVDTPHDLERVRALIMKDGK